MSDVHNAPTPTEPLGNDPEIRSPEGTIKDPGSSTTPPPPATSETKPAEAPAVPEKYDFKPAEGEKLDEALIEKATPIFKELGLSQDSAQKLVDFYNGQVTALEKAKADAFNSTRSGWRDDVLKDTTLGDGKDLRPVVKQTIAGALGQLDPKVAQNFREAMDMTGVGDNPAFVRALYSLSKLVTEGSPVAGAGPSPNGQRDPRTGPRSAAQALYPNLPTSG